MKQSNYWHPACDRFLFQHGDKYDMNQLKTILNRSEKAIRQRMNTYSTSDGKRYTRAQIERKNRLNKADAIINMTIEQGYISCERCGRSAGMPLDCAHIISVKEALESGRAELVWDSANIMILCRECHQKHDKNNVQWS